MGIDLHCHSTHSDGSLSPTDLIKLALTNQATMISITDHDTVSAYRDLPSEIGLHLVPGVEFSSAWRNLDVHVVGLNVDPYVVDMTLVCNEQAKRRLRRAEKIAKKLLSKKLIGSVDAALEGVKKIAKGGTIGRPHFAQYLVEMGSCSDTGAAFKLYLSAGKIGDVKDEWPHMREVVGWIKSLGGVPVLAHPAKYKASLSKLVSMVEDFKSFGGRSIEVASGYQNPETTKLLAGICTRFSLSASCGSDFHSLEKRWSQLGKTQNLPAVCKPVWDEWS